MLLIMFAAALVGAATAVNFTDCGGPNATLRFYDVKLTPDPVIRGANLTIEKFAHSEFLIQNATFDVKNYFVVLGKPIEFIHFHNPVCGDQTKCPFGPGNISLIEGHGGAIPKMSPKGQYMSKGQYLYPDGRVMGCVQLFYEAV